MRTPRVGERAATSPCGLTARSVVIDARVLGEPSGGLRRYGLEVVPRLVRSLAGERRRNVVVFGDGRAFDSEVALPDAVKRLDLPGGHASVLRWWGERIWLPRTLRRLDADCFFSPLGTTVPSSPSLRQVVVVHDLAFLDRSVRLPLQHRWYWRNTLRRASRADQIVVPSRATARRLAEVEPDTTGHISVIEHGVDQVLAPAPDDLAKVPDRLRTTGVPRILWVGTVDQRKNLGFLIDCCERLRCAGVEVELRVVGRAGNDRATIERLRSGDSWVTWHGAVEEASLRRELEQATLLAYPSLDEGFGLPVAEAMAAGLPVVVSDRGSLPEVVGEAGRVLSLQEEVWVAAIRGLLEAPEEQRLLSEAASERASRWTWDSHVTQLVRILLADARDEGLA